MEAGIAQFNFLASDVENAITKNSIKLFNDSSKTQNPTLVIYGGQPGSGKSAIKDHLLERFSDNIAIIDGDTFRKDHPKYPEIKANRPENFSDETFEFSKQVAIGLQDIAAKNGYNYAVETTFSSFDGVNNIINRAKERGFNKFELHLAAVNPDVSLLYTKKRELDGNIGSIGRKINTEAHNERVQKTVATLRESLDKNLFSYIQLYKRTVSITLDGPQSVISKLKSKTDNPIQDLVNERNRLFTQRELSLYQYTAQKLILEKLEKSNAPKHEIDSIKNTFSRFLGNTRNLDK
jgi:UDP-N-acetylglucosamine kinase